MLKVDLITVGKLKEDYRAARRQNAAGPFRCTD